MESLKNELYVVQPFHLKEIKAKQSFCIEWNNLNNANHYILFEQYQISDKDIYVDLVPDLMNTICVEIEDKYISGCFFGRHHNVRRVRYRANCIYFVIRIDPFGQLIPKRHSQMKSIDLIEYVDQIVSIKKITRNYKFCDYKDFLGASFEQRIKLFLNITSQQFEYTNLELINDIIEYARSHKYKVSFEQASHHFGYSSRQIRNIFKNSVGISPKETIQIMRYQDILKKMMQYDYVTIAEIAHNSLFYDEAHFDKFFKKYSGSIPPYKFFNILNEQP